MPSRPRTAEQTEALQKLQHEAGVDFWLEPALGRNVDIRVAPEQVEHFRQKDFLHFFFLG